MQQKTCDICFTFRLVGIRHGLVQSILFYRCGRPKYYPLRQLIKLPTDLDNVFHLFVRHVASNNPLPLAYFTLKRSLRSSLGKIMVRPRASLVSERRAEDPYIVGAKRPFYSFYIGRSIQSPSARQILVCNCATICTRK